MLLPRGNEDDGDQDEELWAQTTVAAQTTINAKAICDFTP
jgi:hypothetical protein